MTSSTITDTPAGAAGSDFARLSARVAAAGLMRRRPGYYVARFLLVGAFAAATAGAFVLLGDSPWQLAVAAAAAVLYGQIALLAHDVAHRQVFRTRGPSAIVGRILGNLGIGMSYGWWQDKHTRHHANPNHEGLDPDVEAGALVWTGEQARASSGLNRLINRHQAVLFFPLLTFAGLDLRRASLQGLLGANGAKVRRRGLELALLATHVVGYLAVLFVVLPPGLALAFFAVHQGLFGIYLGSIFAPNHKGMDMPTTTMDFLRKQVLTSRNVAGGRLTDGLLHVAMGGLNHQIEHHLFPSMPTPNLRRSRKLVREFCAEVGVPYHETGLVRSWSESLGQLREASAPLRG
ncbi:acyl-CoA desaturase [Pseudonocardia sp. DSM 110487]|uniref:fatty acid desaturase family protein n=1 Tax=Pseudonocardia sp. DSM 110487 TaxID=2865833 RepID=UPI001C69749A|nr:acyl-CoA desaturase [Pseudonocardia sp. DSM 110487]QYN31799.1 acyl-CoA desaturase [Pseudonocardia sp. DSM 110487]